jgi:S-adenosylmethionine decarboxylase
MAEAARRAGAHVISQTRYHFGHNSPPGFTAVVLLDESHCSAHSYADLGLIALDVFTCGETSPHDLLDHLRDLVDLGDISVREQPRFSSGDDLADVSDGEDRQLAAATPVGSSGPL